MAAQKGFKHIQFSRLRDLVDFPGLPSDLDEMLYVANATNFRRALMSQYGDPNFDVDKVIAEKGDTMLTYQGYCRFVENDLRFIFPCSNSRSHKQYRRGIKYISRQMLIRGDVSRFPPPAPRP
jgi:pyoverdine/dityrosine biosynthesis protein Dit1